MNICPFLIENLDALNKGGHAIYNWLSAQSTSAEALNQRIFINRFGFMDWRTDEGQGLLENIPPHTVYRRWVDIQDPATSASIIVGSNLGYGINHVLANTPDSHKVIVLEPDPNMLAACLGQTDYRPFLEAKKIHFCVPTDEYLAAVVQQMDLQFIFGSIHVRRDTPSMQLGPDYARWTDRARNRMEQFTVELTTLRYRQDTMVKNELANFDRSLQDGSLQRLQGRGKGLSAVILGAGPSLVQHAPLLRDNPGDALYATSLQTLPALQPHDLKPDFCMAIDYSDGMLRIFDRLDPEWASDIPLIYSTKLDPRVLKQYAGPTIPLWTVGGMATYVMQGREFVLDAGGNVSLTLLRFLNWCKVSQVTMVGQDFGWKGSQSHSDGHHVSKKQIGFNPAMHMHVKNLDGEEVVSSIQYLTAKREMEADIQAMD
ncbi:MAG: motility associated factor glycosyltransferase family protein, partial [Desulfovibrionaceae bacterium]